MRLWPRSERRTLRQARLVQPTYAYYPFDETVANPSVALATPNVWACVRVLADAASSCPLIAYRRVSGDSRKRISGRSSDLLERPAEDTTQADLVATLIAHLTLWGNAYIGKYRDADGRVEQLLPLDPAMVQVERRAGRVVFTVNVAGSTSVHGLDDIIHVKGLSNDGLVGLSPIRQARGALLLDDATRLASTTLFVNNGRPSGILSVAQRANAEQVQSIKDAWATRHGGELAGGIAVLAGDLTFTPVGMPADDAQFVEARKLSATEVARVFRIPPWMIGADGGGTMTYSNVESQMLSFAMLSLQPWLRSIEQALSNDGDLFGPNTYAEFLIDGLLRADSSTRADIYTKALNPDTGWMTRAEVRRAENLPPESLELVDVPVLTPNGEGVFA